LQFRVLVEAGWSVWNRLYSISSEEGARTIGVPVRTEITGETIGWIYLPLVLRNAP
jgi:hypothetical protein